MGTYARSLGYYKDSPLRVALILVLHLALAGLGLLTAWPLAVMVDAVLTDGPTDVLPHRLFLAHLPPTPIGRIIGLAGIALALKALQELGKLCATLRFRLRRRAGAR